MSTMTAEQLIDAYLEANESETDLAYLLSPPGKTAQIGQEKGKAKQSGISKFVSPHGSYRYVYYVDGDAASALQIMKMRDGSGLIANVYTDKQFRRKGYAVKLFARAKKDFRTIKHSQHLSKDGTEWSKSVGERAFR